MSQNRQLITESFEVPVTVAGTATIWREGYPAGSLLPSHWHAVDQLIYAAEGVATVETADGLWVVPPARAVWVPARTPHSIQMSTAVDLISVYLRPNDAPIRRDRCCVVHVSSLLRALILRGAAAEPERTRATERRAAVLLDELRAADVAPLELVLPLDPRAREVAVAFLEDPSQRIARSVWAGRVGASERTLERLFKHETTMTLGQWQRQARLVEALRLLAAGHSVTRVAIDVGYDTPSAFIAMFRRTLGTTPARYFNDDEQR